MCNRNLYRKRSSLYTIARTARDLTIRAWLAKNVQKGKKLKKRIGLDEVINLLTCFHDKQINLYSWKVGLKAALTFSEQQLTRVYSLIVISMLYNILFRFFLESQ